MSLYLSIPLYGYLYLTKLLVYHHKADVLTRSLKSQPCIMYPGIYKGRSSLIHPTSVPTSFSTSSYSYKLHKYSSSIDAFSPNGVRVFTVAKISVALQDMAEDTANEPLMGQEDAHEDADGLERNRDDGQGGKEDGLTSPGLYVWLLTFSAGISGLLFGCEYIFKVTRLPQDIYMQKLTQS